MGKDVLGMFGINKLRLAHGGHKSREQGVCLMEAVAWFNDEPHSDHPRCVDPCLGAFGRRLNDRWTDDERQHLVDLIPKLVGTAGSPEQSRRRAYRLVDGVIRTVLPMILAARWPEHAKACQELAPIMDATSAAAGRKVCRAAYAADAAAAVAAYADADAARKPVVEATLIVFQDAIALQ